MPFSRTITLRILLVFATLATAVPLYGLPPTRFVQLELEGNLDSLPDDARGTFFSLYRPVDDDETLVAKVLSEQSRLSRGMYWVWRKVYPSTLHFDGLSFWGKRRYLQLLAEKHGPCRAGIPCELMERRETAPSYLAKHPFFESPPGTAVGTPVSFTSPEIVTAREKPALSVEEAIERHDALVRASGLEAPHFHVFVRLSKARLAKMREPLLAWLQRTNDELFLAATRQTITNATLSIALRPWVAGTTRRAREILETLGTGPVKPNWQDPSDPKGVFVALRYWGEESHGDVLLSIELRSERTTYDFHDKNPQRFHGHGFTEGENLPKKTRPTAKLRLELSRLWTTAGLLEEGKLELTPHVHRQPDLARAEEAIAKVAAEKGLSGFPTYRQYIQLLFGLDTPTPGLLFPFSDRSRPLLNPATRAFVESYLELANELKHVAFNERYERNQFWNAYDTWAQTEQAYLAALTKPATSCGIEISHEGRRAAEP